MEKTQLDSLLVHALDGCQAVARDGGYEISQEQLAGMWWTLRLVRGVLNDHPVAIKCLQEFGNGNVDLHGMAEFIKKHS